MNKKCVSPNKSTLDAGNAYWMARLSKEIYLRKPGRRQPDAAKILANLQKDDPDFLSVYGFNNNGAQAALIEHKDYLCMVFRGTDQFADRRNSLNFFATKKLFGKFKFHYGIWKSTKAVWRSINKKLEELQQEDEEQERKRPLFITGHSLGGAMATVAAARFVHANKPFTSVYTFGQPRVLTWTSARRFNKLCKARYFRFRNNNDIVTHLPPPWMGYWHIGSYLHISRDMKIHQKVGLGFTLGNLVHSTTAAFKSIRIGAIADHSMAKYLQAVTKWNLKTVKPKKVRSGSK